MLPRKAALTVATALLIGLAAFSAFASGRPGRPFVKGAARCPVFPKSNHWNKRIDHLPVARNSDAIIRTMHADEHLLPDFDMPYTVVSGNQRKYRLDFQYDRDSDRGPYPIPDNVRVENGPDRHAMIVDRDSCRLYELFDLQRSGGGWSAGSGAIWNLRSNRLRPKGYTSADAAGLPIVPGLVRYEEVRKGRIDHAFRVTADNTRGSYIYPARHESSSDQDPSVPAMGTRLRLKASFDISHFPRQSRIILKALKKYGMFVADEGQSWDLSGAPSSGWNGNDLDSFDRVKGSAFEVVDTARLPRPRGR